MFLSACLDEIARTCDDYRLHCAQELRRVTLEWSINILGIDDFWTLRRMTSLSKTLSAEGELEEARALILRALERHEAIQGVPHRDAVKSVDTRSCLDLALCRFTETVSSLRHFAFVQRTAHIPNYQLTLDNVHELAMHFVHQGNAVEGEKLLRRALEGQEKLLGLNNSDTLRTLDNLALTVRKQGNFQDAEALYRHLVEQREKLLGLDNSDTLKGLDDLAHTMFTVRKIRAEVEGLDCRGRLFERRDTFGFEQQRHTPNP